MERNEQKEKKGPHGGDDLSEYGYCCGDYRLICAMCGHRGMKLVSYDDAEHLECPLDKHQATITHHIAEDERL